MPRFDGYCQIITSLIIAVFTITPAYLWKTLERVFPKNASCFDMNYFELVSGVFVNYSWYQGGEKNEK
jgi:hypothetical protein